MNEFTKDIIDLTKGERKFYDISGTKRISLISPHIPVCRRFHEIIINPLSRARIGETVKVKAFLKYSKSKFPQKTLIEFENKFGLNFKEGSNVYEVVSSGEIPTYCLVVSSATSDQPLLDLPIEMELKKLGEINQKTIFYLKDFKPSILEISGIEAPDPNLNMMRNSILEVIPSLSRNKMDLHIVDSIMSPYVGSDTLMHGVDGIGSSYIGELLEGLKSIHKCITETNLCPSISAFGVINFLERKTIPEIEKMRLLGDSKLKVISWNLKSNQDFGNLKLSDFKYITDSPLEAWGIKNLENNIDFQQSLILLTNRNKAISQKLFGNVKNIATKQIMGWFNKDGEKLIHKILDTQNIGGAVARLASFHIAFQPDEEKAINEIENTISSNIGDIIVKIHEMGLTDTKGKDYGLRIEKELDHKVITAFYSTGGRPEEIIKSLMSVVGYTEKRARETLEQLIAQGLIFSSDGGEHYVWSRDSQIKFV